MAGYVEVPADRLSAEALEALLEEFVTREGTDYGLHEHSLGQKKASVRAQLARGEAVIVFDARSESVTIARSSELQNAGPVDEIEP